MRYDQPRLSTQVARKDGTCTPEFDHTLLLVNLDGQRSEEEVPEHAYHDALNRKFDIVRSRT